MMICDLLEARTLLLSRIVTEKALNMPKHSEAVAA